MTMRPTRLISLLLMGIWLAVAAFFAGCEEDAITRSGPLSREGQACYWSSDCETGLICENQRCVRTGGPADGDTHIVDGDHPVADGDDGDDPAEDGDETDGEESEEAPDGDSTEESEGVDQHGHLWLPIPAGVFNMGCTAGTELYCFEYMFPVHEVNISAFQMTETEVTNLQFVNFVNRNGNVCEGQVCVMHDQPYSGIRLDGTSFDCHEGHENRPVRSVTWYGAKAYCESVGGRLPSESEWEYAARGGTSSKYITGGLDDCEAMGEYAVYTDWNTLVRTKLPNGYGLYDVFGGVWEWVQDCYHPNYDSAPSNGEAREDEGECGMRVKRGGCPDIVEGSVIKWVRLASDFRERADAATPYYGTGFRCARDIP